MFRKSLLAVFVVFFILVVSLFPVCSSDDVVCLDGGLCDIVVPDDYESIQDAIDNASVGGCSIFVRSGVYNESVMISKEGVSLIGENSSSTVISGKGFLNVMGVFADFVSVSGFTLTGCFSSGLVVNSSFVMVDDVVVNGCGGSGIELFYSSNVTIKNCKISDINDNAINLKNSDFNLIKENIITGFVLNGIVFSNSDDNIILKNTIQYSQEYGIDLVLSDKNIIDGNIIQNSYFNGVILGGCNNSYLIGNTIRFNNEDGLWIYYSCNNRIINNSIYNNNLYRQL